MHDCEKIVNFHGGVGSILKDKVYDLRHKPNIHSPERYTNPRQHPILTKGIQGHYVP